MTDPRTILEREFGRVDVPPFTLDTFHTRRERKRRNRRLAAGAVGVSIAFAGVFIAARVLDAYRDRTAGQTVRNGAIAFEGDRGLYLSGADGTDLHLAVSNPAAPSEACGSEGDPLLHVPWVGVVARRHAARVRVRRALLGGELRRHVPLRDGCRDGGVRLLARCPGPARRPQGNLRRRAAYLVVPRWTADRTLVG